MSVLEIRRVSKSYGPVRALSGVSLYFASGKRYGLVGPNGAGKSTLVKIMSGLVPYDRGHILFNGEEITNLNTRKALKNKIAAIHQGVPLIPTLGLEQNIELGCESFIPSLQEPFRSAFEAIHDLLDLKKTPYELNSEEVFFVQLCRSLRWQPSVLILDEVMSRLSTTSKECTHTLIGPLVENGLTLLIVSHDLQEIQKNCEEVVGLHDGKVVLQKTTDDLDLGTFRRSIFGRNAKPSPPTLTDVPAALPSVEFTVKGLQISEEAPKISFSVRGGETICIYSDEGEFARDICETIAGLRTAYDGELWINGRKLNQWNREMLRRLNIVWVPPEPQSCSFSRMSVAENLVYSQANSLARYGILRTGDVIDQAEAIVREYEITPPKLEMPFCYLSGGNQQKAIIGRALSMKALVKPCVIIAFSPTIGLDEPARARFWRFLEREQTFKIPIVYGSSDLQECKLIGSTVLMADSRKGLLQLSGEGST